MFHKAIQTLEDDLFCFVLNDFPLPLGANLERLDDGSGIANTLLKREAKYHNGCRGSFCSHHAVSTGQETRGKVG